MSYLGHFSVCVFMVHSEFHSNNFFVKIALCSFFFKKFSCIFVVLSVGIIIIIANVTLQIHIRRMNRKYVHS